MTVDAQSVSRVAIAVAAALAAACGSSHDGGTAAPAATAAAPPRSAAATTDAAAAPAEHEHEHVPPHGGTLIEIGEEYAHLELVVNRSTGLVTVYALDGEAERPLRLAQPSIDLQILPSSGAPFTVTLAPVASELTGERAGDTSQYAATAPAIARLPRFDGRVGRVEIRGRPFTDVSFAWRAAVER